MTAKPALTADEAETLRCKRIADGFTAVAVLMTSWAGWHLGGDSLFASAVLAALMGLVTYGFAHILTQIDRYWQAGRRIAAGGLAIVGALFFVGEYNGHLMFNVSHRSSDIQQADLQTTRYDDTRNSVKDLEGKKALLEKRLADLEATKGWHASKPSRAYDAEIETQAAAVELEASRGGCKDRCIEKKRVLAELEANKATAIAHEQDKAMLDATIASLNKLRETSAATDKGKSITADSTTLFAQISTGSLAPASAALAWTNIGVGGFISLLSSIAATVFNWLASGVRTTTAAVSRVRSAMTREPEADPLQAQIEELKAMLAQMARAPAPVAAPPRMPAYEVPVAPHAAAPAPLAQPMNVYLQADSPDMSGIMEALTKHFGVKRGGLAAA